MEKSFGCAFACADAIMRLRFDKHGEDARFALLEQASFEKNAQI